MRYKLLPRIPFRHFLSMILFLSLFVIDVEGKSSKIKSSYKCNLAVVAIFQNEAPYLKEWIDFHRLLGVQHFVLINHFSTDNYKEVLKPYRKAGIVELINWPYNYKSMGEWNGIQCNAYQYVLDKVRGKVKWLAFLDTDEFLFPTQTDDLLKFLSEYENYGGVGANWQMFGTSWVPKIPDNELLIKALHLKAPENYGVNIHIKSIVRPEHTLGPAGNPHTFNYKPGYYQVNTNKEQFKGPFSPYIAVDKLRINHYNLRDQYFLYQCKIPRYERWGVRISRIPDRERDLNQIDDDTIQRFAPKLKALMNEPIKKRKKK